MSILHPASVFGRHEFVVRRIHVAPGADAAGRLPGLPPGHQRGGDRRPRDLPTPRRPNPRARPHHDPGPRVERDLPAHPVSRAGGAGHRQPRQAEPRLTIRTAENFRYTLERAHRGDRLPVHHLARVPHARLAPHAEWWVEKRRPAAGRGPVRSANTPRPRPPRRFSASWVVAAVYLAGTLAVVYHFSNGLWTAGITWGLWTSPHAQRWANVPCLIDRGSPWPSIGRRRRRQHARASVFAHLKLHDQRTRRTMADPQVMVVGGGLAGLAADHEARGAGTSASA